jgi:hypothetical protein
LLPDGSFGSYCTLFILGHMYYGMLLIILVWVVFLYMCIYSFCSEYPSFFFWYFITFGRQWDIFWNKRQARRCQPFTQYTVKDKTDNLANQRVEASVNSPALFFGWVPAASPFSLENKNYKEE